MFACLQWWVIEVGPEKLTWSQSARCGTRGCCDLERWYAVISLESKVLAAAPACGAAWIFLISCSFGFSFVFDACICVHNFSWRWALKRSGLDWSIWQAQNTSSGGSTSQTRPIARGSPALDAIWYFIDRSKKQQTSCMIRQESPLNVSQRLQYH